MKSASIENSLILRFLNAPFYSTFSSICLSNAISFRISDRVNVDFAELPIQRYEGEGRDFGDRMTKTSETFIQREGQYDGYVSRFFYFSDRVSVIKLRTLLVLLYT